MDRRTLRNKLLDHGLRLTRQRLLIARVMLEGPRHLSADQVFEEVNATHREVSRATVYNTLKAFTAHGLLREVNIEPGRSFYDSTVTPHHHFYNRETGELVDIPKDRLAVTGIPAPPAGTEMTDVEVVVELRGRSGA